MEQEQPWRYRRPDWEESRYRVSQHTNSGPVRWDRIQRVVFHYTASTNMPDGDPGELPYWPAVLRAIRNIQRYYADSRGYSIGYNGGLAQNGDLIELRGDTYACAANRGYNSTSVALLCLVDGDDELTPEATRAARAFVAWAEARAGRPLDIVGHRDVGGTDCPGEGMYRQIQRGEFRPREDTVNPTSPTRIYDSRRTHGLLTAGVARTIDTGLPGTRAVFVNLTAVGGTDLGYLTCWAGGPPPEISNLNYGPNLPIANTAIVPLDSQGRFQVQASAPVHVIVDLQAIIP